MGNIDKRIRGSVEPDLKKAPSGKADSAFRLKGAKVKNVAEVARHFKSSKTRSGMIALFAGPAGSGKKRAAQALAAEIGMDISRIDLSTVISKYIGETEKNLDRVFETARAREEILLLEEADALLGKRTEISDAHDRYVNSDVNYLLQRIERYPGLVILATNDKNKIDETLLSRVQFELAFPLAKMI